MSGRFQHSPAFFQPFIQSLCLLAAPQVSRGSCSMAAASYDQLLRQVEVLKMENSNLRQELQDNSNHLTKLETEASNMKVGADTPRTSHLVQIVLINLNETTNQ